MTFGHLFILVLASCGVLHVTGQYSAEYQIDDCTGSVAVTLEADKITFDWQSFVCTKKNQITHLSVSALPPMFSQTENPIDVCKGLGSRIFNHTIGDSMDTVNSTSAAGSPPTVFHRGLILTNEESSITLCATILPTADLDPSTSTMETFQAKIMGPIVGDVTIRTSKTVSKSFVYADLYEKSPTSASKTLSISTSTTLTYEVCATTTSSSDSDAKLLEFSPSTDASKPKSLAGGETDQTNFADNLPTVVIKDGNKIIACGKLRKINRKVATAEIASNGLISKLKLTQLSPFDPTFVGLDLTDTKVLPTSYTIHEFPLRQRVDASLDQCAQIGDIFNLYGSSPEYGDLQARNRAMTNGDLGAVQTLGKDFHLPLFGRHSVIGRSFQMVSGGGKRSCSVIQLDGVEMITAVVRFRTNGVYGDMIMRQEKDQWKAETSFFSDLAHYDGSSTSNHNFHVHVVKVDDGDGTCGSTAGHYNPLQVNVTFQYKSWCSPSTAERCELGDLSRKHSGLSISSSLSTTAAKKFFTDSFLPLSGTFTVIGRSIVIHEANGGKPRFACADIIPLNPVKLVAGSTGLTLTQNSEFDPTKVSWSGAPTTISEKFAIHERSSTGSEKCAPENIGDVYNPFNVDESSITNGTQDQYKVGNLLKKSSVERTKDINLPLFTSLSVSGRTVVIDDTNCPQLSPDARNGAVAEATAEFAYDRFTGLLKMKQVLYNDGTTSATSVEVKFQVPGGNISENHNYHVHIHPVAKFSTCDGIEGHFDPFDVKKTNYAEICTTVNQLACEVGDLSNKHGKISINGEWQFYNDDNLPLGGVNTVIGRSIKVHGNVESPLHHCASILPPLEKTYTICFPSTTTYRRETFTAAIGGQLKININRVIIIHNTKVPNDGGDGCNCVLVYIPGDVQSSAINSLIESNLKDYDSEGKCKSSKGSSGMNSSSSSTSATSILVLSLLFFSSLFVRSI